MPTLPNATFLNAALRHSASPADLTRILLQEYLLRDEAGRTEMAMVMIGHIAATEAMHRRSSLLRIV